MSGLNAAHSIHGSTPALGANTGSKVIYRSAEFLRSVPPVGESGPSPDPAVRKLFAAHSVLGTLTDQEQRALLTWSRIHTATRQQTIFQQNDPSNAVILVLAGHVKLSRPAADGREVFLDIAGPGVCIGDVAVLQKQSHDADVIALSPCRLLLIDARQFRQIFERRTDALLAMLRLANERFQRVAEQLEDACVLSASSRLAKALLRLARLSSSAYNGGAVLPLSQRELGVMTGVSREAVNKQLRVWKAAGWIALTNGAVTSIRTAALSLQTGDADRGAERQSALA
jgi:CRP-like cAMP-binding protein